MSTNKRVSVRAAVRDAMREDKAVRGGKVPLLNGVTADSFINLAQRLGVGADNDMSRSTYGFNPISRQRVLLEWIHRGSWLGGAAIDIIPDDMTRKGVEMTNEMPPEDAQAIEHTITQLGIWQQTNDTLKWSRLYGGSIAVMLVDGQDLRTPLRLETVKKDQFKGLLALDRWMIEPSLEDLVTEYGPHLGLPKYYRVGNNAPALRGQAIHYSRCAFRLEGVRLPYQQRLTENLWGISIIERLYDRMVSFDSATMGAAQLVYKSYLRTLKVEGFRDIVAAGGDILNGFMTFVEMMRRYQGQEGITVIDAADEFEVQQTSAYSSVGDIILQIGQQLSGALQIPLVRLFGQSPAGLNSTGESDLRTYYDEINRRQETDLRDGITTCYKLAAASSGITLPDDFSVEFASLWDMDDKEKAETAKTTGEAVGAAVDSGLIGRRTALMELRQSSRRTGLFSNITQETIDAADDEVMPPAHESLMEGAGFGSSPLDKMRSNLAQKIPAEEGGDGKTGSNRTTDALGTRPRRRVEL